MNTGTLTIEEVANIFLSDVTTIYRHHLAGNLPKMELSGKQYLMKEIDLLNHLGIENLDEPFIIINDAAKLVNLKKERLRKAAKENEINYYRLTNKGASKLLFRASEVIEWNKIRFIAYTGGSERNLRHKINKSTAGKLLEIAYQNKHLSHSQYEILNAFYTEEKNMTEIGGSYALTRARIGQLLQKANYKYSLSLDKLYTTIQEHLSLSKEVKELRTNKQLLIKEVKSLQEENDSFRERSSMSKRNHLHVEEDLFLDTHIKNLGLSKRAYNWLKSAEVFTPREMLAQGSSGLLKHRNFGKKSLVEIEKVLQKKGYELKP